LASREGGPWRIPLTYWKVVAIEKSSGDVVATAFLQGQIKFVRALFETRVFSNLRNNTLSELQSEDMQTTIQNVEAETGLDFGELGKLDVSSALESTRQTRLLSTTKDIILDFE